MAGPCYMKWNMMDLRPREFVLPDLYAVVLFYRSDLCASREEKKVRWRIKIGFKELRGQTACTGLEDKCINIYFSTTSHFVPSLLLFLHKSIPAHLSASLSSPCSSPKYPRLRMAQTDSHL